LRAIGRWFFGKFWANSKLPQRRVQTLAFACRGKHCSDTADGAQNFVLRNCLVGSSRDERFELCHCVLYFLSQDSESTVKQALEQFFSLHGFGSHAQPSR